MQYIERERKPERRRREDIYIERNPETKISHLLVHSHKAKMCDLKLGARDKIQVSHIDGRRFGRICQDLHISRNLKPRGSPGYWPQTFHYGILAV